MIYNCMFLRFWSKKEKRAYERIPTYLDIKVLNGDFPHNGLVTNLSENGMYFITGANLYSGLNIQVSISIKDDNVKVPVKVVRTKKDNMYDGYGAELSNPFQDYEDIIHSLKTLT